MRKERLIPTPTPGKSVKDSVETELNNILRGTFPQV